MYSTHACLCRAYPPGTWFQELCDDDYEFEPHAWIEEDRPAKVWIKHTPICIWTRKNQFPGEPLTKIVGWGPEYLDGAWWVWIEPKPEASIP